MLVSGIPAPQHYDALMLLSFGGPEGHDDVRPFLENVTRGRGIPAHRLDEVEEHYHHFGGKSPLNDLNREIIANIEAELARRGHDLPVYFGNRNWHPLAGDTACAMARDGVRNAVVFATSAWAGYSGCRQYDEDIELMAHQLAEEGLGPVTFTKLRQFFDHPKFIAATAGAVREAYAKLPADKRDGARLMFTAHSIPLSMDAAAGVDKEGSLYSRQIHEAARLVAKACGVADYDVVWQSRSGPPHIPWLEPDIVDHVTALHEAGELSAAVVCPVGFLSDHIEVVWDLDSELAEEAAEFGLPIQRAATVGHTALFASLIVDLIEELSAGATPQSLGDVPVKGCSVNGAPCESTCCVPPKKHGPTGPKRSGHPG
ncbi:ferrochelatase [Corynebacterium mendelii]|uniref:Coproporphyrin III ferrochelatase n=1 Tax=Corynebacterium mendelii TaxID=2765362 RepID=A0A939DZ29_9CORY|nr:ferrochelatase [Corynebacterium mendelii]MBN9643470.1 ferrochelatase [Corynebacterium mendelii]